MHWVSLENLNCKLSSSTLSFCVARQCRSQDDKSKILYTKPPCKESDNPPYSTWYNHILISRSFNTSQKVHTPGIFYILFKWQIQYIYIWFINRPTQSLCQNCRSFQDMSRIRIIDVSALFCKIDEVVKKVEYLLTDMFDSCHMSIWI